MTDSMPIETTLKTSDLPEAEVNKESFHYSRKRYGSLVYKDILLSPIRIISSALITLLFFYVALKPNIEPIFQIIFGVSALLFSLITSYFIIWIVKMLLDMSSTLRISQVTIKEKMTSSLSTRSGRYGVSIFSLIADIFNIDPLSYSFLMNELKGTFHVDEKMYTTLNTGDVVEIHYTPHLQYIMSITVLNKVFETIPDEVEKLQSKRAEFNAGMGSRKSELKYVFYAFGIFFALSFVGNIIVLIIKIFRGDYS